MKRRRGALAWYKYHLASAQSEAEERIQRRYAPLIERARSELSAARTALAAVERNEPWLSRFRYFFGSASEYRSRVIGPPARAVQEVSSRLAVLERQVADECVIARRQGASNYELQRALRREAKVAQAERVAVRREQRRIRYLEHSPSLRSAARFLKSFLLRTIHPNSEILTCHYCGTVVRVRRAHLDHKKPIARGGTNRRSNLAFTCAACNLAKGKKTEEEFLRDQTR